MSGATSRGLGAPSCVLVAVNYDTFKVLVTTIWLGINIPDPAVLLTREPVVRPICLL
jgi:hypothetical protein